MPLNMINERKIKMNTTEQISMLLNQIKHKAPLVHHITNYVTVNDCANVTLAIGASPIMADDIEEVQEITAMSQALLINIGTLNSRTLTSMLEAGKKANELNIPVVLDPVGVGASGLRNKAVGQLIEQVNISVIRGNMSEIRFIAGLDSMTKGVDASETDLNNSVTSGIDTAKTLADKLGCVVAVTGAVDIVSNGSRTICIENGHKILSAVTGTGCMCSSLIASSCAATSDYFLAAVSGILYMCIAGEIAYENARKKENASFHAALLDEIGRLDVETLKMRAKIYEA